MAIDITNQEALKKLTLKDLIADAVERKDKKALEWLKKEANAKKQRAKADGTTYEVNKSIVEIRAAYVKAFLGYQPKGKKSAEAAKARKREKKQKELDDMFADAFAALDK